MMAPVRRWTQLLGSCLYAMVVRPGPHGGDAASCSCCSSPSSTPAGMNLADRGGVHAARARSASSGIGMMAAILPLLYVERGAQMTFVLQSCLLLVSGVYYSVDVLPGWMQVLSHLSPATYVLDGVRAGLLDGTPVTALRRRRRPAARDGLRPHPGRAVGVRPRRAVREADRQAEAGGLMDDVERPRTALADLGWDPGWAARLPAARRGGLAPARVVAAHRDAWVLATTAGGDRTPWSPAACATRRSGPATSRRSAIGSRPPAPAPAMRPGRHPGRPPSPDRVPSQRRRRNRRRRTAGRRAGPGRQRRRRVRW